MKVIFIHQQDIQYKMYTLRISLLIIAEIFEYYTFGSRMKWYYTQGYTRKIIVAVIIRLFDITAVYYH